MKLIPVVSSNVASIGYEDGIIEVHFHNGYRSSTTYALNNAIKILWVLSPTKLTSLLEELIEEYFINNPHAAKSTLTQETLLIYAMISHVIKSISSKNEIEKDIPVLAKSKITFLRAIYAAKCTWFTEDFLHQLIMNKEERPEYFTTEVTNKCEKISSSFEPTEACTVLVYLIKKLQIEICRNKSVLQCAESPICNDFCQVKILTTKNFFKI